MKEFDTIAAIATPIGEAGISIIRVSGNKSLEIVNKIFKHKSGNDILNMKHYTMKYGNITGIVNGEIIDEVIISYMKRPKSFTAEDTVEINCHGGILSTKLVLEEVIKAGGRLAEPGEFTKRAFLNGRIDLSQAEAVIDLITSKTEVSMKAAVMQAGGRLSKEILVLRDELLEMIAHIEATVDYPEDDLEEVTSENTIENLDIMLNRIELLISTSDEGKIIREGLKTVIIGKPNVGKSSLLNALLEEKRAIVTEIAGTTRDVIEEYINIAGIPIKIIDTAGLRTTEDVVEKIGIEKSKEKVDEADLVILILDASCKLDNDDLKILDYIKNKKYIVLMNKIDIEFKGINDNLNRDELNNVIHISAKTGYGIDNLKNRINEMFFSGEIKKNELIITNTRHKEALINAKHHCISAKQALKNTSAIDLASIDLRNAWYSLGQITGDTVEEDLIDIIFKNFCLGK